MTTPETLAAMLNDDELSTRAAELADDLRQREASDTDRAHFRALWRALEAVRVEQKSRAMRALAARNARRLAEEASRAVLRAARRWVERGEEIEDGEALTAAVLAEAEALRACEAVDDA
jgi:hypothetical protein